MFGFLPHMFFFKINIKRLDIQILDVRVVTMNQTSLFMQYFICILETNPTQFRLNL